MHISRRMLLGGATAAAALTPVLSGAATTDAALLAAKMQGTATPGMAALVIRNFRPERELVAGRRRLGADARVQPGDRWHLGSNGKAIVATMVARLVERGDLGWDRPLARMLPQFAATMHESYRDVTLPELFSHRSGLPHDLSDVQDGFFNALFTDQTTLPAQRLRYLDRALREPPAAAKRTEVSYSNTGYVVAAACAENATGRAFEALVVEEVFAPLRMSSISFDPFGGGGPIGHRDGRVADRPSDTNPRMFAPAGGISMSLPDWSRFCIDHMQGEHGRGRLLSRETYRLLHKPQDAGGFSALGWGYVPSFLGRRGPGLFHAGSDGNWTSVVMLFCQTGNGVLVASNAYQSMGGERVVHETMRAIVPLIAEAEPVAAK